MNIHKAIKLFDNLTTEVSNTNTIHYLDKKDVIEILTKIYSEFDMEINDLKQEVSSLENELANEQYGASI